MRRLILRNTILTTGRSEEKGSLGIEGERIAWISRGACAEPAFDGAEVMDLGGLHLMAGGIDAHVHFREPGMTEKADMESESRAALLGGVTSFIDMPNTRPATITKERLEEKLSLARGRTYANYAFHLGASNDNASLLETCDRSRFGAVKVFMGSSTGNMLVDNDSSLRRIFSISDKAVLIHSEDEGEIRAALELAISKYGQDNIPFSAHALIRSRKACVLSTAKAVKMAIELGTRLHILHVSTAEEVEIIREAKAQNPLISAETSANYLWFSEEDYPRLKGRLKCNPSVKSTTDREALREALRDGTIDSVGSDHAPHRLCEKERPYLNCPSGVPSVGQSLSVLVTVARESGIPLTRVASAFSERPAEIIGVKARGFLKEGYFADLVAFDPDARYQVAAAENNSGTADWLSTGINYKCGWSPYEGVSLNGPAETVIIGGTPAVLHRRLTRQEPLGRPLEFKKL